MQITRESEHLTSKVAATDVALDLAACFPACLEPQTMTEDEHRYSSSVNGLAIVQVLGSFDAIMGHSRRNSARERAFGQQEEEEKGGVPTFG